MDLLGHLGEETTRSRRVQRAIEDLQAGKRRSRPHSALENQTPQGAAESAQDSKMMRRIDELNYMYA